MSKISVREFARRNKVSDTAIHKHIKADRIVKGIIRDAEGKLKGLDDVIAQEEYNAWGGGDHSHNYEGGKRSNRTGTGRVSPGPEENKEKSDAAPVSNVGPDKLTTDARRMKAVYTAKKDELVYKKMAGELIDKGEVYKQLYGFGTLIKDEMLKIPARVIDSILAAPNRNTSKNLLMEEISKALEKIIESQGKIKLK